MTEKEKRKARKKIRRLSEQLAASERAKKQLMTMPLTFRPIPGGDNDETNKPAR